MIGSTVVLTALVVVVPADEAGFVFVTGHSAAVSDSPVVPAVLHELEQRQEDAQGSPFRPEGPLPLLTPPATPPEALVPDPAYDEGRTEDIEPLPLPEFPDGFPVIGPEEGDGYAGSRWECRQAKRGTFGIAVDCWIDQGVTINTDSPRNRSNYPVGFNDRSNDYQMNQFYLVLQRAVNRCGGSWDVGGRVDLLYGTDWIFTAARGLETRGDFSPKWNSHRYGLAMPQLYLEMYAPWGNGVTMKFGHFYTILGYETVPAPENFFYSHSYAKLFGEPFTHTGFLGSTSLGQVTFHAGMTRGWDNWEDNNNDLAVLAGVDWTSCDGRTSLAFAVHTGREADEPPSQDEVRSTFSLVLQHYIASRCQYVLEYVHGFEDDGARRNRDAEWYGVSQYLFYEINPCWKAGLRFEWFCDEDAALISRRRGADYFELTLGLNYTPTPRVTLRPSIRWDWVDTPGARPFLGGKEHDQLLLDCDLIVRF